MLCDFSRQRKTLKDCINYTTVLNCSWTLLQQLRLCMFEGGKKKVYINSKFITYDCTVGISTRKQLSLSLPLCWRGSRPICGLARGLLFVNVSISCVLRNVELFNLNFPRCAEAPLSLGPAALPCPWHKAITQTQSHTGHAGAAAVRIAPQGNGKNIAPGRQNKSYNESPRQSQFNPCSAGRHEHC